MISVKRNTWRALSVVIGDCRRKGNFEYCQGKEQMNILILQFIYVPENRSVIFFPMNYNFEGFSLFLFLVPVDKEFVLCFNHLCLNSLGLGLGWGPIWQWEPCLIALGPKISND